MHIQLRRFCITLLSFILPTYLCGQSNTKVSPGFIEVRDSALLSIIHKDAPIEQIADGFDWSEGPLWIEKHKMLLFSDVPKNIIYKWTAEKGKEIYLSPSGYTGKIKRGGEAGSNGLALDNKRRLVICQHGDRRIAIMDAQILQPKPVFKKVADRYNGKRFDSPNDLVYRENGDLYFTDPPYGLLNRAADSSKEAVYQGVYKVTEKGVITLLTDTITRPNGIAFFPGHKKLLIANSDPEKPYWYIYDLDEHGLLKNGRIFYDASEALNMIPGNPDGVKIDRNGNVFATGPGGVWIFNEQGKVLGRIRLNSMAANCAFSDDEKTIFITADSEVLKVKLR